MGLLYTQFKTFFLNALITFQLFSTCSLFVATHMSFTCQHGQLLSAHHYLALLWLHNVRLTCKAHFENSCSKLLTQCIKHNLDRRCNFLQFFSLPFLFPEGGETSQTFTE